MRPQQQDPDPPEQIGRGADERAESSADQRGGKLVAARAGRPDPDDACGQGDVGEHHHADHHPHREAEPRGSPAGNDDRREPQRDADDHPRSEDDRGVPSRERKPRPDLRLARLRDGEREHRVEEEARRRHERYHDDERERARRAPGVEVLPFEHVRLEVEHRHPDPHRRQDLDEHEFPIDENEPQTLEQHHERADREHERGKDPTRLAQREHSRLNRRLVPGLYRIDERAALRPQNLATRTARGLLPVRGGRHQPASSVRASLSARQSAQTGENTAQTSESVIMMKTQPMSVRTTPKEPNARPFAFMAAPRKRGDTAMNPPTTTVASTAPGMSARSATSLCSRNRGTQSQKTVDAANHAGTTRSRPWVLRPSAATTKSATEPARTKKKIANSP